MERPLAPDTLAEVRAAIEDAFPNICSLLQKRHRRIQEIYSHCKKKHYTPMMMEKPMAKVGRNAPCPCGSGKKYKKCCGRG